MNTEQQQRIEQIRERQTLRRDRVMLAIEGALCEDIEELLSIVEEQEADGEVESFSASHFAFGPCFHSMVKPDCPSCCQSHAVRMEQQLGKLEASTALPERERIERALREHMAHCYQVYKGVPPTVDDWIGGALHYVMWGLDRDMPLRSDAALAMRSLCVEKVRERLAVLEQQTRESDGIARAACQGRDSAIRDIIKELESLSIQEQKS